MDRGAELASCLFLAQCTAHIMAFPRLPDEFAVRQPRNGEKTHAPRAAMHGSVSQTR